MAFIIRHKMQRTRGEGFVERDELLDNKLVSVGRGADRDLCLNDPRVLLRHVELEFTDGAVYVRSVDAEEIRIDNQSVSGARMEVGSTLEVGPYELRLLEVNDADAVIELELVHALTDAEAELRNRTRIGVNSIGLTIRGWAWVTVAIMVLIGAALPLSNQFSGSSSENPRSGMASTPSFDRFWSPGPMSSGHAAFEQSCSHCHVNAFERVANTSCLACHRTLTAHGDASVVPALGLDAQACTTCHTEHVGGEFPLRNAKTATLCTDCHVDVAAIAAKSDVAMVKSFNDHPEFRATRPTFGDPDVLIRSARLTTEEGRVDGSGLKFPHKKHLNPLGVRARDGSKKTFTCSSCHTQSATTGVMKTITFDQQCRSCHLLAFSPEAPEKSLPHGDTAAAKSMIRDHFAALALRGGGSGDAIVNNASRRLPGEDLTEEERESALAWAEARATETLSGPLGKGLCAGCHVLNEGSTADDWTVAAVRPSTNWFPHARFNHDPHVITECTTCHAAPTSETGSDLLMPSVAVCKTCHSDEPEPGKVVSSCGSCHDFHGFRQPGELQATVQ